VGAALGDDGAGAAIGGDGAGAALGGDVAAAAVGALEVVGGDAGVVEGRAMNAVCAGAIGVVSGMPDGDRDIVEVARSTGEPDALEAAGGALALGSSATTWAV
jgi:hypothetical protein